MFYCLVRIQFRSCAIKTDKTNAYRSKVGQDPPRSVDGRVTRGVYDDCDLDC